MLCHFWATHLIDFAIWKGVAPSAMVPAASGKEGECEHGVVDHGTMQWCLSLTNNGLASSTHLFAVSGMPVEWLCCKPRNMLLSVPQARPQQLPAALLSPVVNPLPLIHCSAGEGEAAFAVHLIILPVAVIGVGP